MFRSILLNIMSTAPVGTSLRISVGSWYTMHDLVVEGFVPGTRVNILDVRNDSFNHKGSCWPAVLGPGEIASNCVLFRDTGNLR